MELQGFTIPRKKRVVDDTRISRPAEPETVANGSELLVSAHEKQRREVEEIFLTNLSDRKLRDFLSVENVKVISNSLLEKKFKKFQTSMKRSQSDKVSYAFLLMGFDEASISNIAKNGLPVGSSFHGDLGNRMQGVYLYNHPDLVTPSYSFKNVVQRIMCFKVLRGHSMMVGLDSDSLDASLNGSSHSAAADFALQSRLQKFRNNAVFLYELDEASQPVKFPSNVLPFAVVDLVHGKKVHYGKLPSYASFLKIGAHKSELCSVVPKTGLFSGADCIFSSAIDTDLLLSPLDIAECLHIGYNAYAWTSILDLLPLRQLIEPGHWGRLLTEQEIFIEINSKIRFYMTHTVFNSKHESYSRIVSGLRDKKMSLIGVSNDVTIVLIPDGELASFLGFPWTENNQLNALLFSSRHSCLGITDLDRANRESERLRDGALMKDRDNYLIADERAKAIMVHHFRNLKRYDNAGKKHLGTPLHVRKPPSVPRKLEVNGNGSTKPPSTQNSPETDYRDFKFEFISTSVANKTKSCVSKKLTNNGNRGMPIGRIPNKMTKFSQKRIRWTDELNRPLTHFRIIEARGEHNPHSQQLHDMDHDEGKSLRQGQLPKVRPVDSIAGISHAPPAPLTLSPKLNDDRPPVKNNMFREAMSGLSKPITDEPTSLPAFELPYQQKEKPAPMVPSKSNSERVVNTSPYANPPPPPPPRPAGRPATNGATIISTPAALLQKLSNNRSQRAYSPSDAYLNKERNDSTECDMDIDSDGGSVVEVEKDEKPEEEEFYDPHDIDYDMKIGPVEEPSTSVKNNEHERAKEQAQAEKSKEVEANKDCGRSNESVDGDADGTLSKDEPPKESFNVLDLVLKQIGVTDIQRIVSSAKKPVEVCQRSSEDTDLRNMQESNAEPKAIPLSPVARDQIAPPASPTPVIEDVDLRVLQPQVHVAFSLKKDVPKSSKVTSVFGEEDEDDSEKSKENSSSKGGNLTTTMKEDKDERAGENTSKKDAKERISDHENEKDRDRYRRERDDSHHSRGGDRDRYKNRDSRERTRERSREREKSSDRYRKDRYEDRDRRERRDHDDRRHRHSSSRRDHSRTPPKAPPLVQQSLAAEETLDIPLPLAPPSSKPAEMIASATAPPLAVIPPPPQLIPIGPSPTAAKTPASRQAADRLQALMREKQKKISALEVPPPVRQDSMFVQSTYTAPFNCSINQASNSHWQQPSAMIQGINSLKNIPIENSVFSALGIQPELISRLRSVAAAKQNSSEVKPDAVRIPTEEMPPPDSPPPAASPEPELTYPQAIPVIGSKTMSIPLSCHDTDFRLQNQHHQDNISSSPSSSVKEISPNKKTFPKKIDHDRHKKDEDKDVMKGWGAALVRKKTDVKDSIDSSDEEGELSSDEEVSIISPSRPNGDSHVEKIDIQQKPLPSPPQDPNPAPFSSPPPFITQAASFQPRQPLMGNSGQPLMGAAPMPVGNNHFIGTMNAPRFAPTYREPPPGYGFENNLHPPKRMIVVVPDSLSFKAQMRPEDLDSLLLKMQNTTVAQPLFLYHNFISMELDRQLEDPGCNQETKKAANKFRIIINNFTRTQVALQMGPHDCDQKANRNHLEILGCLKTIFTGVRSKNPNVHVEMVYMTHVSPATQLGRNLQELGIRVMRPAQLTTQYPNLG